MLDTVQVTAQTAAASTVPATTSPLLAAFSDAADSVSKSLEGMAAEHSQMQIYDMYNVPEQSAVTFTCENKDILVSAIVVEQFQFNMESKWDSKAIGAISDSKFLTLIDTLAQDTAGVSVNQPIFNRRTWGGTSPFETSLKVRFVAQTSGRDDVYVPVLKLANLLVPRRIWGVPGLEKSLGIFAPPGPVPFGGFLVDVMISAMNLNVPKSSFDGDSVSIKYGNLIDVKYGYVTKIQGMFSKSLDKDGYPLAAEAVVSFGSMDSPYFDPTDVGKGPTVTESMNNIFRNAGAAPSNLVGYSMDSLTKAIAEMRSGVQASGINLTSNPTVTSAPAGSGAMSPGKFSTPQ